MIETIDISNIGIYRYYNYNTSTDELCYRFIREIFSSFAYIFTNKNAYTPLNITNSMYNHACIIKPCAAKNKKLKMVIISGGNKINYYGSTLTTASKFISLNTTISNCSVLELIKAEKSRFIKLAILLNNKPVAIADLGIIAIKNDKSLAEQLAEKICQIYVFNSPETGKIKEILLNKFINMGISPGKSSDFITLKTKVKGKVVYRNFFEISRKIIMRPNIQNITVPQLVKQFKITEIPEEMTHKYFNFSIQPNGEIIKCSQETIVI